MPGEVRIGRKRLTFAVTLFLALSLTACGTLFGDSDEDELPEPTLSAEDAAGIDYEVDLDLEGDTDLQDLIEASSELLRLQDNPPQTLARLERRVDRDRETFEKVLRSEGYYAGTIEYEIDHEAEPVEVDFNIDTGRAYRLAAYDIVYTAPGDEPCPECDLDALNLELGQRARAEAVVNAESLLVRRLQELGYPLAAVEDRKTVVDHDDATMIVTLTVDQGPLAGYGPIEVAGAEDVRESYIRRLVPLEPGARYDQETVDEARRRLADTGLFESAQIRTAEAVDADGNVPLTVQVLERPHRSIGGSASYSSTEGARGEVFWEHRNLLHENERFRITGTAAEIEQGLTMNFRKPHFGTLDQDLVVDLAGLRRTTDAFDELSGIGSVVLERSLFEHWRVSGGVSTQYSVIDEDGVETTTLLFGLPLTAARDDTDSILDPTRGSRLAFTVTPYYGTLDRELTFVSATAGGSAYFSLDDESRYVFASRARVGTLYGEDTLDIPANMRFYAGGGGSVRGYEFQKVGPLDDDDDPLGGSSLLEVGAEMRIKITDTIGIVPFIDGGMVYDSEFPDDLDLLWAAGIGARYYTGFGPFRLDVAFPINGRDSDDFFQFYVSLGQAF